MSTLRFACKYVYDLSPYQAVFHIKLDKNEILLSCSSFMRWTQDKTQRYESNAVLLAERSVATADEAMCPHCAKIFGCSFNMRSLSSKYSFPYHVTGFYLVKLSVAPGY